MRRRRQIPFPRYLSSRSVETASLSDVSSTIPLRLLALKMTPEAQVGVAGECERRRRRWRC